MPLTHSQKQTLADELVAVMENFHRRFEQVSDHYEAVMTQPCADHLVITLQPKKRETHPEK